MMNAWKYNRDIENPPEEELTVAHGPRDRHVFDTPRPNRQPSWTKCEKFEASRLRCLRALSVRQIQRDSRTKPEVSDSGKNAAVLSSWLYKQ